MDLTKRKISITADVKDNKIKVRFAPKLHELHPTERFTNLNVLLAGMPLALEIIMDDIPAIRGATTKERENDIYIFRHGPGELKLYETRKQIYDTLTTTFSNMLSQLFPDVEYVESTRQKQQELAFEMSPEDYEFHQAQIEAVKEYVMTYDEEEDSHYALHPTKGSEEPKA